MPVKLIGNKTPVSKRGRSDPRANALRRRLRVYLGRGHYFVYRLVDK